MVNARLQLLTVTVTVECTKEGVKFSASGDIGSGAVTLRSHTDVEKPDNNIDIELSEPVALTFSLKYLVNFCKATGLSSSVKLCLSSEVPLLVEYELSGGSYLRYYLAPKVCSKTNPTRLKKFRLIVASLHRSATKSDDKSHELRMEHQGPWHKLYGYHKLA